MSFNGRANRQRSQPLGFGVRLHVVTLVEIEHVHVVLPSFAAVFATSAPSRLTCFHVRQNKSLIFSTTSMKKFDILGRNSRNGRLGSPTKGRRIQPIWAPTIPNTMTQMRNTVFTCGPSTWPSMRSRAPGVAGTCLGATVAYGTVGSGPGSAGRGGGEAGGRSSASRRDW